MGTAVERHQVLAFRARRQGLARETAELHDLAVLDLGLQDTPAGSARLAVAARLDRRASALAAGARRDPMADEGLAVVWSVRGAPHLHRVEDLPLLARALWPSSDEDAAAKLSWRVEDFAPGPAQAVREAAAVVARVVHETWPKGRVSEKRPELTKGELSSEITRHVPEGLARYCAGCDTVHVHEQVLRMAALAGGLGVVPDTTPVRHRPLPADLPSGPGDPAPMVERVLSLLGPASLGDVAAYLGTSKAALRPHWPSTGLAEVAVEGVKGTQWLPEDLLDELVEAEEVAEVRLLPPGDPMLQGRDRELLVPDSSLRKTLWRPLNSPGALWSEGEVVGTWRPKASANKLTLTVEAVRELASSERDGLEEEAERVAAVRGLDRAQLKLVEP